MTAVKDLLRGRKIGDVFSIHPDASLMQAISALSEKNIGALLVIDTDGKIVGILSERDIVRRVDLRDYTTADIRVADIMTAKVVYIEANQPLEASMVLMNDVGIRHLPVMENGVLLGLISIRDVLKAIILEQKIVISHLENYIRGG